MDVDVNDRLPVNSNLKCNVCGENQFDEREGFYYCQECGTKQEQLRAIEVEKDEEFDPDKIIMTKKQKINVVKAEKPQLTSWECYNYILRGFVEELLSFGAKEELKLMTLQVWAAYLRRMEIAFFNKKHPDLPKLGIKYLPNDAKTIYNHSKQIREKRRRRRSEDNSGTESRSYRSFNRSKRKLDESNYSLISATSGGTGFTSSTSANSNRAIKIGLNSKARTFFKRKMPVKHLEKHMTDSEGQLKCHKEPVAREINRSDYNMLLINTKQIYSIIAVALNLIGDDIQLCDLVRFINERHIGSSNVLQYFPENIANHGKEMLTKINFYRNPEKFSDKALRDHMAILCRNIGINAVKKPDIKKLVLRYITELCLPVEIATYIEKLINLLPPNFNTRVNGCYPGFEARAMAYIIFTLKLLFGLDDFKEHHMSQAAKLLNSKIQQLNEKSKEERPLLFVWSEWMEYIEMRKIIVSQFNTSFCEQFKQCQSANQVLERMADEMRRTEEKNNLLNEKPENISFSHKLKNFKSIFERFQENYKSSEKDNKPALLIDFKPSFTPGLSYLKNILLFCNNETNTNSTNVEIPHYMHVDHSKRDINSFLQVKPVIKYFKDHKLNLKVEVLDTNANKQQVGMFRTPASYHKKETLQKASFDVTDKKWDDIVIQHAAQQSTEDLQFYTDFKTYSAYYHNKMNLKRQFFNPYMNYDLNLLHEDKTNESEGNENEVKENETAKNPSIISKHSQRGKKSSFNNDTLDDFKSIHSFDLFSENNMEPIDTKDFITQPRRNLDEIDLFEGISDEESVLNDADDTEFNLNVTDNSEPANKLNKTDSSLIFEEFIKIEPDSNETLKSEEILKMYISNMDCWMMLGHIIKMTATQRSQLQDKLPRSFNWLLETCAQTISVDWTAVLEQLICLETIFCLGINDPKTIINCVYFSSLNPNKEIQTIINNSREIW